MNVNTPKVVYLGGKKIKKLYNQGCMKTKKVLEKIGLK